MSDYTKLTAFDTKDSLTTGDPLKRVKGTELDDEFDAIAVAIATKANSASPALSGTPTAPTASYGTNTTQLATTAFVQAALSAMYPVGSVYTNISDGTNPASLLGFGTWVAITGKVIVGLDSSDTSFDTAGETGGSKDAIAVSHTHTITDPGHNHTGSTYQYLLRPPYSNSLTGNDRDGSGSEQAVGGGDGGVMVDRTTGITINSAGSSGTNANLQPYVVAYVWKRTA
jgi:hypothetical protein